MDLVDCDDISENAILLELSRRFHELDIYSSIGSILIALNPYKVVPGLYSNDNLSKYCSNSQLLKRNQYRREKPHIWMIPRAAYLQLASDKKPQAIVISGESGAGKTEATKLCLQMLSAVHMTTTDAIAKEHDRGGDHQRMEDRILATNPLLESFGNSKTARNNNSSRFGKWIQINYHMDDKSHGSQPMLVGAEITQYLLEKSRVIVHEADERNFHIFYQLCASGIMDIQPPACYRYLRHSKSMKIPGVDDKKDFEQTCDSMRNLGFTDEDRDTIFSALKAILLLGNIQFGGGSAAAATSDGSALSISNEYLNLLSNAANLLGLSVDDLATSLVTRSMVIRGETTVVHFNSVQSQDAVNALTKEIYGRIFDYIVYRANLSIKPDHDQSDLDARQSSRECQIGILDIFGFEKFKHNSFEQLCINYANEKLHQYFILFVLRKEQELYQSERVDFDAVSPIDNTDVLSLLEAKQIGMFSRLDDEIKIPKATDDSFVRKIASDHNSKDPNRRLFKDVKMPVAQFEIRHFAGTIRYDATGFLEKNRDKLHDHLESLIFSSTNEYFRFIVNKSWINSSDTVEGGKQQVITSSSIASRFQMQLQNLMDVLSSSQPHFIKCIKPNNSKQEQIFDNETVLLQLRYSGILEAIKVRKSGYPIRRTHEEFWTAYWGLVIDMKRKAFLSLDARDKCRAIIGELIPDLDAVKLGQSLMFLKGEVIINLENEKIKCQETRVVKIQSILYKKLAVNKFNRLRLIRDDLLSCIKMGELNDRKNVSVIDELSDMIQKAKANKLPVPIINKADDLLQRLKEIRQCLEELENYTSDNSGTLAEFKLLRRLADTAEKYMISSPKLDEIYSRLNIIKERAESLLKLETATNLGDEDAIVAAISDIEGLKQLYGPYGEEEVAAAKVACSCISEDMRVLQMIIDEASKLTSVLNKLLEMNQYDVLSQVKTCNEVIEKNLDVWNKRRLYAVQLNDIIALAQGMRDLHIAWLSEEWKNCGLTLYRIRLSCAGTTKMFSDQSNLSLSKLQGKLVISSLDILTSLIAIENVFLEYKIHVKYITPKFVSIIGENRKGDSASIDSQSITGEIESLAGSEWLGEKRYELVNMLKYYMEIRSLFEYRLWSKVLSFTESSLFYQKRIDLFSAWLKKLKGSENIDQSFISEVETLIADNSVPKSITDRFPKLPSTFSGILDELIQDVDAMYRDAFSGYMLNVLRRVSQAENIAPEEILDTKNMRTEGLQATIELCEEIFKEFDVITKHNNYPKLLRICECFRLLVQLRSFHINSEWGKFIELDDKMIFAALDAETINDDIAVEILSTCQVQIAGLFTRGVLSHFEMVLKSHIRDAPFMFSTERDEIFIHRNETLIRDSLQAIDYYDRFKSYHSQQESDLDKLAGFCNTLGIARLAFSNDKVVEKLTLSLAYLRELETSLNEVDFYASISESFRQELSSMEIAIRYYSTIWSIESALASDQPIAYFIPANEASARKRTFSSAPFVTQGLRPKTLSFDVAINSGAGSSQQAESTQILSFLKEDNIVMNESALDGQGLEQALNEARSLQEAMEDSNIESPPLFLQYLEALEGILLTRTSVLSCNLALALKTLNKVVQANLPTTVPHIDHEVKANLSLLSNYGIIFACYNALSKGQPMGPIGQFDYRNIPIDLLEEAILLGQTGALTSKRADSLFRAVLIVADLRKAQRNGDWGEINAAIDRAKVENLGYGYTEISLAEINRAVIEKDNHENIQSLKAGIVNEKLLMKEGIIDFESVAIKELGAAISRVLTSMPEDTRGFPLKPLLTLADSIMKMRRSIIQKDDYFRNLFDVMKSSLDSFQNDLERDHSGMLRKGSSFRNSSALHRGTIAGVPKEKENKVSSPNPSLSPNQRAPTNHAFEEFHQLIECIKGEISNVEHYFGIQELEKNLNTNLGSNGVEEISPGKINKSSIDTEKLKAAIDQANLLESSRSSIPSHLKSLTKVGVIILDIRQAVKNDLWDQMGSLLEETLGGEVSHWPDYSRREVQIVRREVENRWIISNLTAALTKGKLTGKLGEISIVDVANAHLSGYISTAKSLNPRTEEALLLIDAAEKMRDLRNLLISKNESAPVTMDDILQINWSVVKSMAIEILSSIDQRKTHPVVYAETRLIGDVAEDRVICSALEHALGTCCAAGTPGQLDMTNLSIKDLEKAYQQAMKSSVKTANSASLMAVCRQMQRLRESLRRAELAGTKDASQEAWMTIQQILAEISQQRQTEVCWELCEAEVDLISRHATVQEVKYSLIRSAVDASFVYSERNEHVPIDDISNLTIAFDSLKSLCDDLDNILTFTRGLSFTCDPLMEFIACATTLRMYRSMIIQQDWEKLEVVVSDRNLRNNLKKIPEVNAEYSWILCEYNNNMAIKIIKDALGLSSGSIDKGGDSGVHDGSSTGASDEENWDVEFLKGIRFSERNENLKTAIETAKRFKITSKLGKAWLECCEQMHLLRTSLERQDNVHAAQALRWFKSNARTCPHSIKLEAQRAYVLHQNDLLLKGLKTALGEGKATGKRGSMDYSTITISGLEALLKQSEEIEPKLVEVQELLEAAKVVLNIRRALLKGDMMSLTGMIEHLSYEESFPVVIIEEVALARAELDNFISIDSLESALKSFEDGDSNGMDFGFLNNSRLSSDPDANSSTQEIPADEALDASLSNSRKVKGMSILEGLNIQRRYSFANKGAAVDPTTIDIAPLDAGLRLACDHGVFSEKAARLLRTVELIKSLRVAMKEFNWPKVEEILSSAQFDENVGTMWDELATREMQTIRCQLEMRVAIVDLAKALKIGWANCCHGIVDTSSMDTSILSDAIERADHCISELRLTVEDAQEEMKIKENAARRVRFQMDISKDDAANNENGVARQVQLLMESSRIVLEIREALSVGSIEIAGNLADEALRKDLHYSVLDELRLYSKEINTTLMSMKVAERLKVATLLGSVNPLRNAIKDALESDLHSDSDLGVVGTLSHASNYYNQLLNIREKLLSLSNAYEISAFDKILALAKGLNYSDMEIKAVEERREYLTHFQRQLELFEQMWVLISSEQVFQYVCKEVGQYADRMGIRNHPVSKRVNLLLYLNSDSLRTVRVSQALKQRQWHAIANVTIELKKQYLALPSSINKYRLENFPRLRRPEDFALRMTIVSEELLRNMLNFTEQPLPTSLTKLTPQLAALSVFLFTNYIRGLEKNFFSCYEVILYQLLCLGRRCSILRDEIFLQVIKQIRHNSDVASVIRLWKLICACLYYFPSSREFENYLELFLKQTADKENTSTGFDYSIPSPVPKYADRAIRLLHRAVFLYGYNATLPSLSKGDCSSMKNWIESDNHDPSLPILFSDDAALSSYNNIIPASSDTQRPLDLENVICVDLSKQADSLKVTMNTDAAVAAVTAAQAAAAQAAAALTRPGTGIGGSRPAVVAASKPPLPQPIVDQSSFKILGVRENWVNRFRLFNFKSVQKDGGRINRSKFSASLVSTLGTSSKWDMDRMDREILFFLVLGKKPSGITRSEIYREFVYDKSSFHFGSEEEAANSALRRQWLGQHIDQLISPLQQQQLLARQTKQHLTIGPDGNLVEESGGFSAEMFFSQLQTSDFVMYVERFWDSIISRMSRECLQFPFSHLERRSISLPSEGNESEPRRSPLRRELGQRFGANDPAFVSVSSHASSNDDIDISWELFREIVLVGMAKYLSTQRGNNESPRMN